MFMEEGQASLNNRAHDMIQEVQNAEAIWLKKFLEIVRQERKKSSKCQLQLASIISVGSELDLG